MFSLGTHVTPTALKLMLDVSARRTSMSAVSVQPEVKYSFVGRHKAVDVVQNV